mmetsp:Transcript_14901/g.23266  ORF Transcript_14901/g.23266 Transcript_14901/m.23266 type:complete len:206 (-) Transcript_14901:752-1369(-)
MAVQSNARHTTTNCAQRMVYVATTTAITPRTASASTPTPMTIAVRLMHRHRFQRALKKTRHPVSPSSSSMTRVPTEWMSFTIYVRLALRRVKLQRMAVSTSCTINTTSHTIANGRITCRLLDHSALRLPTVHCLISVAISPLRATMCKEEFVMTALSICRGMERMDSCFKLIMLRKNVICWVDSRVLRHALCCMIPSTIQHEALL